MPIELATRRNGVGGTPLGPRSVSRARPVRIVFLTVMPSPYQRELFHALQNSNQFDVRVLYYTPMAGDRDWNVSALAPFEKIMPGRTLTWFGRSAHINPGVIRTLEHAPADLIVVSDYSAPTAQLVMRHLGRTGQPWVFWGEKPGFRDRGRLGEHLRRLLQRPLRKASAIAAIGSWAVESYQVMVPGVPVVNIPYTCDLEPYRMAAEQGTRATRSTTVDILFSGQLIPRKGADLLLEAFKRIADDLPELRLMLLGHGPERERLAASVPSSLKDRVVFLGFLQPADLPAVFAAADLFVLPSRHDGWGVVVNEALGAGLPIIASDRVGAAHDLIRDGANGYITPMGDAGALAEALRRLGSSKSRREAFAATSRTLSKDWGLPSAVRRWVHLSEQCVAQGGRT